MSVMRRDYACKRSDGAIGVATPKVRRPRAYIGDYLGYVITISNELGAAMHLDGWVVAFNAPDGSQNGWDSQTDSTVIEAGQATTMRLVPGYDGWNPMTGGSELEDSCVVLKVAGEPL